MQGPLPEALAATDPGWLGPRPSVIAHSYGTILLYRFLRDRRNHIVERVLLRGSPLAYTTPFDGLAGRHAGVHSLLGGSDEALMLSPLLRAIGRFLGGDLDFPPHHRALGVGANWYADSHHDAGLGGGHLSLVDGDRPDSWSCRHCENVGSADVHTWSVPTWDHTTVHRDDVHRYWFPLLFGWEPAKWALYVDSLRELVPDVSDSDLQIDDRKLAQWLLDDSLDVFWRPHRNAADFIMAALQSTVQSSTQLRSFTRKAGPNFVPGIARLFLVQARRALDEWYDTEAPLHGKIAASDDPRRALLPEALATLTRDIVAGLLQSDGR